MKNEILNQNISYKEVLQLAKGKGYDQVISIGQKIWGDGAIPYQEVDYKTMLCELTLIQKWLRDEHKLFVSISYLSGLFWLELVKDYNTKQLLPILKFHSYEEALLTGIEAALNLIK